MGERGPRAQSFFGIEMIILTNHRRLTDLIKNTSSDSDNLLHRYNFMEENRLF